MKNILFLICHMLTVLLVLSEVLQASAEAKGIGEFLPDPRMIREMDKKTSATLLERHLSEYEQCADTFDEMKKIILWKAEAGINDADHALERMLSRISKDHPLGIHLLYLKYRAYSESGMETAANSAGLKMIDRFNSVRKTYNNIAEIERQLAPITMRVASNLKNLNDKQQRKVSTFLESFKNADDIQIRANYYLKKGEHYLSGPERNLAKAADNYRQYFFLLPDLYGSSYLEMARHQMITFASSELLGAGRCDLAIEFVAGILEEDVSSKYHKRLLMEIRSFNEMHNIDNPTSGGIGAQPIIRLDGGGGR